MRAGFIRRASPKRLQGTVAAEQSRSLGVTEPVSKEPALGSPAEDTQLDTSIMALCLCLKAEAPNSDTRRISIR